MESESRAGYGVAVMFILAVIGAWWAFGNFEQASRAAEESAAAAASASATAVPTPATLPEDVVVGTAVDATTGQVEETQFHFERGDNVAFSAWLGQGAGVEEVQVTLLRLGSAGFEQVGDPRPFTIDPNAFVVSGTLPASLVLDGSGPGTYLLSLQFPSGDQIGYGAFQVESTAPDSIEYFANGPQRALISAGTETGVQFDADGNVSGQLESTLDHGSAAPTTFRATFGGQSYLFISAGVWAGYFLPESDTVTLAGP